MLTDRDQIEHILVRYAELFDEGRWKECAALFRHGRMSSSFDGQWRGEAEFLQQHERYSIRYDDGTPKTIHLITNIRIEIADDARTAESMCYVTVFQRTEQLPFQPIYTGQYFDMFHKVDGEWFIKERVSKARLRGDQSRHQLPKVIGA